jgi:hypothetical protein
VYIGRKGASCFLLFVEGFAGEHSFSRNPGPAPLEQPPFTSRGNGAVESGSSEVLEPRRSKFLRRKSSALEKSRAKAHPDGHHFKKVQCEKEL